MSESNDDHRSRFWKISPGSGASEWNEFMRRGIAAIEWTGSPNIQTLNADSQQQLLEALKEFDALQGHGFNLPYVTQQFWHFIHDMAPGDLICAYGKKHVLGWGKIIGEYDHVVDDFSYPHRRRIDWLSTSSIGIESFPQALQDKLQRNRTIIPLTKEEFAEVIGTPPTPELGSTLAAELAAHGLSFTPWQIATFCTALQTKGFVILTGISGTGKSKLAQAVARLLKKQSHRPHSATLADNEAASLMPAPAENAKAGNMGKTPRFRQTITIPAPESAAQIGRLYVRTPLQEASPSFAIPDVGEELEVRVTLGEKSGVARLAARDHSLNNNPVVELFVPQFMKDWLHQLPIGKHELFAEPEFEGRIVKELRFIGWEGEPNAFSGEHLGHQEYADARSDVLDAQAPAIAASPAASSLATDVTDPNWLFVPIRPDWRDGKSLLGYYNPLTERYEWTPFLRFLLSAVDSFESRDGRAWFVILDEMNLAHVEYYFADLLSVLESGRDDDGWTREPLRLGYPDTAEGDLPPLEVFLPPSLYVVGTVNADETTHAFSPKVLDRAFTLELNTVDFDAYPPAVGATPGASPQAGADLLVAFTDGGRFPRIDKRVIAAHVAAHPEVRIWLSALNALLAPHGLHFGYRVFDEIVTFLHQAEGNSLFADLGGYEAGFDAAVLMKVLPKFHGSRGKLEAPLRAVLAWCLDPASNAAPVSIQSGLDPVSPSPGMYAYRMPRTAERAQRMLDELHRDGFTSFG